MTPNNRIQNAAFKPYELPSSLMHRIHDNLPRESEALLKAIEDAIQCAFNAGIQFSSASENKMETTPDLKMKFMDGSPVDSTYQAAIEKLTSDALQAEDNFPVDELEESAKLTHPSP